MERPADEQLLLPVLEQTLLAHAPLLEQLGVQIEIEVSPRTTRRWPPALTQLLVGNLLANALAHARTPQIRIDPQRNRVDTTPIRHCNGIELQWNAAEPAT